MAELLGRIDRYELVRELGRGGMAIVYLAKQTGLNRLVALKRLNGVELGAGSLAERFARESQLTAQLAHERIVTVYDYFEADGTPFIAMEYLPGGSLRPHVKRLSHDQTLAILGDVLEGLGCAEANHVVHRDLKPENLLLTTSGHAKIADFGIAKAIGELTGATGLTATGLALGTPTYMAPERALGRPVTSATDRYALGVIAYELLTGAPPFVTADAPIALLFQHVNQVPASLEGVAGVDDARADGAARLLSKDPGDRFADTAEALDELRRIPPRGAAGQARPEPTPRPDSDYETWAEPRRPTPGPVVIPPPEDGVGVDTPVGEVVEVADTGSALGFVPGVHEPEAVPAEPEAVPPGPEPVRAEPEPVPTVPEPVPADPDPVAEREQEPVALTAAPQRPLPPPPEPPGAGREPGGGRRRGLLVAAALTAIAAVTAAVILLGGGADDEGGGGGGGQQTRTATAFAFGDSDRQEVVVSVIHDTQRRVVVIHGGPEDRRPSQEIDAEEAGLGEPVDEFGWALSSGDFNRDGRADLAIGTSKRDVVSVGYGTPDGGFRFTTTTAADAELPAGAGLYGFPLVAADFDADGYSDLAVGAAGQGDAAGSGAIPLLFGGPEGLRSAGARTLTLDAASQFGRRLRAGDVDGDGALDLIEAAPDTTIDGHVAWCRGGAEGPDACELLDSEGASNVTTGDLDEDGFDEIVVGIAEQTGDTTAEREAVRGELKIWPGSAQGPAEPQTIDPSNLGLTLEPGERFGAATDAGNIDGEPGDEVVVGAPGKSCAYVLEWQSGTVEGIRELVPCDDVPFNFGSSLAVLDVTPASELDVVVAARRAEDAEQRLQILPGGERAVEPLRGVMSDGRGLEPSEITLGRRGGGGLM